MLNMVGIMGCKPHIALVFIRGHYVNGFSMH